MEKIKLLLIEDYKDVLKALELFLEDEKVEIKGVQTPEKFLQIIYDKGYIPDVILLDMRLKGFYAETLIKLLLDSEMLQHIPIILTSGMEIEELEELVQKYPNVKDYVQKPIILKELLEKIEKVISER